MNQTLNASQIPISLKEQKVNMFEFLLSSTGRDGVDKVIDFVKRTDFYYAPASSKYHSNYQGGLLDHSLIVYSLANKYRAVIVGEKPDLAGKIKDESIIISSLLHDICKACFYVQTEKWKKDSSSNWIQYPGYEVNDTFPIGHGEKSVIMLQNIGLTLYPDEMLAIRYHMGMYDDANCSLKQAQFNAVQMTPLVPIIQMADFTASSMMETVYKF